MVEIPKFAAEWFLPFAAPICLWVAYTDLKSMKILNYAVIALVAVYAVIGIFVMPSFADYLWRYLHLVVILIIGFVLSLTGGFGAGDAKFAAAMALFVAVGDTGKVMMIAALCLIGAFILHRVARGIPAIRRMTPDWASWEAKKFPMGTALGATLLIYLFLGANYGIPNPS